MLAKGKGEGFVPGFVSSFRQKGKSLCLALLYGSHEGEWTADTQLNQMQEDGSFW